MEVANNVSGYMAMSGYAGAAGGTVSARLSQRMAAVENDALVARREAPNEMQAARMRADAPIRREGEAAASAQARDPARLRGQGQNAAREGEQAWAARQTQTQTRAREGEDARGEGEVAAHAPHRGGTGSAGAPSRPVFEVEYEGKHRVLKVNDSKGVLIYQVPSKGQLHLIQAEENKVRMALGIEAFA